MRLIIAEKPSVASAIAVELGGGKRQEGCIVCGDTTVAYCLGHLLEQAEPDAYLPASAGKKFWRKEDLPIFPRRWKYKPKSAGRKQLSLLGKLIKQATEVVHAGDPDREGQSLVQLVLEHHKCKAPVKRFWVSAQDSVSIKRGLAALQDNSEFEGWYNAAIARSRADWLIGMNLTRAFTLAAAARGSVLSVGRVQSPCLALVVERDRRIETFIAVDFYELMVTVVHDNGQFLAKWQVPSTSKGLDDEGRLLIRSEAQKAAAELDGVNGVISGFKKEQKFEAVPLGFALSDLTLLASQRFGFGADQVLKITQSLYEKHKLVSYPRTDCRYLPLTQYNDARTTLNVLFSNYRALAAQVKQADPTIKSRIWNDSKVTAHHAIVPTMQRADLSRLSDAEAKIYDLIARRYLAQFYPPHEYSLTSVGVAAAGHKLTASGRVVVTPGWKLVDGSVAQRRKADSNPSDTRQGGQIEQTLPKMSKGDPILSTKPEIKDKKTTPPKHYTEATLVKAMENIAREVDNPDYKKLLRDGDGIGTSATRAGIIVTLKTRGYLEDQGRYIVSTAHGQHVLDALPDAIKSPVLTAQYERELLAIQNRQGSMKNFIKSQTVLVSENLNYFERLAGSALSLSSNHAQRKTPAAGAQSRRKQKTAKAASTPKPKVSEKPGNTKASAVYSCKKCGSALVRREDIKRKKTWWWGCSAFPKCRQTYQERNKAPVFDT